jgi:hypothetical protein
MLDVRCSQLFVNGNGVARFQRHNVAVEQIARIDAGLITLAGDGDFLRVVAPGVIGRRDGLRQGQSFDPRNIGVFHRADDDDALPHPRHFGKRIPLAGQISRLHLGIGLRLGDAAAKRRCDQKRRNPADKKKFQEPIHFTPAA